MFHCENPTPDAATPRTAERRTACGMRASPTGGVLRKQACCRLLSVLQSESLSSRVANIFAVLNLQLHARCTRCKVDLATSHLPQLPAPRGRPKEPKPKQMQCADNVNACCAVPRKSATQNSAMLCHCLRVCRAAFAESRHKIYWTQCWDTFTCNKRCYCTAMHDLADEKAVFRRNSAKSS